MRSTSTPAAPAAPVTDAFSPVSILPPEPRVYAALRESVSDADSKVELIFQLSTKPDELWIGMYVQLWRTFYPSIPAPAIRFKSIALHCEPAKLQSQLEIARVIIQWANQLAAPIVRGAAAQREADMRRHRALDEFQMRPRALPELPGDAGGDASASIARMDARMFLARQEHDAEEKELRKKLALEEIDAAIASLVAP